MTVTWDKFSLSQQIINNLAWVKVPSVGVGEKRTQKKRLDMEVRRRNIGETADTGKEEPENISSFEDGEEAYREGLELYSQAQHSSFQDTDVLTKSIRRIITASERGVDDASVWMKSFLDSPSVDLPSQLVREMQVMSDATPTEKQVRLAAKSMFQKMAAGRETIPGKEISKKARSLLETEDATHLKKSSKMLEGSVSRLMHDALVINQKDEVTEEAFAEAAMTYARGEIGSPQGEMRGLTPEQMAEFSNANIIKKISEYPKQTAVYVKNVLLKTIEKRGVRWIWSYIPTKQFYWLLAIYLVPMLTLNFIISTIFSAIFAGALIAMIIATLQVAANSMGAFMQQEFISIFQYYSTDSKNKIDPTKSQSKLIFRSMIPYLTFFISMVVAVLSLGLAHQVPYINEILAMLAGFFSFGVFLQFEIYSYPLLLASLASRLMSWFYAFLLVISPMIHIPDFFFIIAENVVSIPFFGGYSFTINLMSFIQFPLHLTIVGYLLYTKTWANIFSGLGPYTICVCWFVLCRNFFAASSVDHLISAGVLGVGLAGSVPFFPLIFLASPLFFLYYYGISQEFFISLAFVTIVSILVVFVAAKFKQIKEAKWLNIPLEYIFLFQIILAIPIVFFGSSLYAKRYDTETLPVVTLEQYTEYCGPSNWHNSNMVQTQLNCLHLEGRLFESEGRIKSVKISNVVNTRAASLASLPSSLKITLTCMFGETEPMCGNREDMTTCVPSKCHFQHSYLFTYELKLDMPLADGKGNISTTLTIANKFRPAVLKMTTGMNIRFNATFMGGMGSDALSLQAVSVLLPDIGGAGSGEADEEEWGEAVEGVLWRAARSLRNALYFVLEVLVGYTPTAAHKR